MGLDLTVLGKPKEGYEQEFGQLWTQINVANGAIPASDMAQKGVFSRLAGALKKPTDTAPLIERFNEISIPVYESLKAPVVGRDKPANEWLLEQQKTSGQDVDPEKLVAEMQGYHVLQLLDDCDGFPVYTHAYAYEGVDRTSFRGKFLESCGDVIGGKLLEQAWIPMLSDEFSRYASELKSRANQYAEAHNVTRVLGDKTYMWDNEDEPDAKAHIVDQAARWCSYWSKRGHGCEPFY